MPAAASIGHVDGICAEPGSRSLTSLFRGAAHMMRRALGTDIPSSEPGRSASRRCSDAYSHIKNIMQNLFIQNYRGYAVQPSAHRLADGYFSSNLLLERPETRAVDTRYRFYALDYFPSEEEAVRYSHRWARDWIDTRG